jgi:hypothetical protein
MNNTFGKTKKELVQMFTSLTTTGKYKTLTIQDLIQHGRMVDFRQIQMLTIPLGDGDNPGALGTLLTNRVVATMINWSWHAQRVWVQSYPMTQAECIYHHTLLSISRRMANHLAMQSTPT